MEDYNRTEVEGVFGVIVDIVQTRPLVLLGFVHPECVVLQNRGCGREMPFDSHRWGGGGKKRLDWVEGGKEAGFSYALFRIRDI